MRGKPEIKYVDDVEEETEEREEMGNAFIENLHRLYESPRHHTRRWIDIPLQERISMFEEDRRRSRDTVIMRFMVGIFTIALILVIAFGYIYTVSGNEPVQDEDDAYIEKQQKDIGEHAKVIKRTDLLR